ncbi:MAG: hypothetical protein JWQ10_3364 [Herbaspirillum sp.]|nr:hypothetical protein [Herbaspirillum sp.]
MDSLFLGIEKIITPHGIDLALFKNYLSADITKKIGEKFIDKIVFEHDFVPQFNRNVSTRTILINIPHLYLELEFLEPGHAEKIFISNSNCTQAIGVLKGEGKLSKFAAPSTQNNCVTLVTTEILEPGNAKILSNEYYFISNNSDKPLFLLYLADRQSLSKGSTVSAYRIDTGKFSHLISGSLSSSRLETMISVMGEMKYASCSDVVKKLSAEHPDYFIRWESIRTYLKVNPSQAIPFLSDILKTEKHPHVVNAARKSLDLIKRSFNDG